MHSTSFFLITITPNYTRQDGYHLLDCLLRFWYIAHSDYPAIYELNIECKRLINYVELILLNNCFVNRFKQIQNKHIFNIYFIIIKLSIAISDHYLEDHHGVNA